MSEGAMLAASGLLQSAQEQTPQKVDRPGVVYTFICKDGPDGTRLRQEHLAAHLAWVEPQWRRYAMAGPIRNAQNTMIGSVFMIWGADLDEARAVVEGDPYFKAGVYGAIETLMVTPAVGVWIGGKVW
jgi:uncharacterized protein YciI